MAFSVEVPGQVQVSKTFTAVPGTYDIDVDIRLKNISAEKLTDQVGISFYFQPYGALQKEDSYNLSRLALYAKGALSTYAPKDLAEKEEIFRPPLSWVGYENNYFIQAIIPLEEQGFQIVPRVLDAGKELIQLVYLTDPFFLDAQQEKSLKFTMR